MVSVGCGGMPEVRLQRVSGESWSYSQLEVVGENTSRKLPLPTDPGWPWQAPPSGLWVSTRARSLLRTGVKTITLDHDRPDE
jgi:hypothetical protein